jgi:hypothetical protein
MQTMQRTGCKTCRGQDADHAEDKKIRAERVTEKTLISKDRRRVMMGQDRCETLKGTVRPDLICMRVVSLESPLKGHQPL